MAGALLMVAVLTSAVLTASAGSSFASAATLDLVLYADGTAHVSSLFETDPASSDLMVGLLGSSVDNFVASNPDGSVLPHRIAGGTAIVDVSGSESVSIDYDIHDLISKQGRIWTFAVTLPVDSTVLMPPNAVIVGMSVTPSGVATSENSSVVLQMGAGVTEIRYVFGVGGGGGGGDGNTAGDPPPAALFHLSTLETGILIVAGAVTAAAAAIVIKKRYGSFTSRSAVASRPSMSRFSATSPPEPPSAKPAGGTVHEPKVSHGDPPDVEAMLGMIPDMREDDKGIVRFIHKNGGQVLESDLRKKFLQPRTTMWRAVKRLERHGIITISKKDKQNLVVLRTDLKAKDGE